MITVISLFNYNMQQLTNLDKFSQAWKILDKFVQV